MECQKKPEKWARWNEPKIELFIKIVIVFWREKLKRDVLNFLNGETLPLVHLDHKHVKKSAKLLGTDARESKSLQIKYVRIVESFKKKPGLAKTLLEGIRVVEENPQINFLLGSRLFSSRYGGLFEEFERVVKECTGMVVARRRGDQGGVTSLTQANGSPTDGTNCNQDIHKSKVCEDKSRKRIGKRGTERKRVPLEGFRKSVRLASKVGQVTTQGVVKVGEAGQVRTGGPTDETVTSQVNCADSFVRQFAVANVENHQISANLAWRQTLFGKIASIFSRGNQQI